MVNGKTYTQDNDQSSPGHSVDAHDNYVYNVDRLCIHIERKISENFP